MKSTPYEEGTPDRPLIVLAEAPGRTEMRFGQPLIGPSGEVFNDCMRVAQLSRRQCYILNVWPYCVEKDKTGNIFNPLTSEALFTAKSGLTEHGINEAQATLRKIKEAKADTILTLGQPAMHLAIGGPKRPMMKWRGSILRGAERVGERRVIPTVHPAATLHGTYLWRYLIINDMKRAQQEMGIGLDLRLPKRTIMLEPNLGDILNYVEHCRSVGILATDIEVINHQVSCFSLSHSPDQCLVVPLHHEGGADYWDIEDEEKIWLAYASIMGDPEVMKVNQNIVGFDSPFLLKQNRIVTRGPIGDTMIAQHIMYPDFPKGLDMITSLHTREPYFKDEGKMWKGLGGDIEEFWTYNGKDACVALEAWHVLAQEMDETGYRETYDMTVAMADPLMFMSMRGIAVDHEALEKTKVEIAAKIEGLETELAEVADYPFNPNSPVQCKKYFYEHKGITPYRGTAGSVTTDDKAMARIYRRYNLKEAKLVQDLRAYKKLKGTYLEMGFDADARLRCSWNPRGTTTGRLSSSQTVFNTGANLQNLHPEFKHFLVADGE